MQTIFIYMHCIIHLHVSSHAWTIFSIVYIEPTCIIDNRSYIGMYLLHIETASAALLLLS